MMNTTFFAGIAGLAGIAGVCVITPATSAEQRVKFGANWVAQAEHGGFYQAVADGTYEACGLDVEIVPGGPGVNNRALLVAGKIDYYMGGNLLASFASAQAGVPTVTLAGLFQKEPQILMTHPDQGLDTWEDLKTIETLYISNMGLQSYFQWMLSVGFRDEQRKPYTFNSAPFLANKKSGQQGYITSEPYAIRQQGGFEPNAFLLADHGFDTYSTMIVAMRDTVAQKPEATRCFVEGSIIGWTNYLYGERAKADALIRKHNPEMTREMIDFSVAQMKKYGIVDSGDALRLGIGAMTEARIKGFFDKMVKAGLVEKDLDYQKSYDLRFVNKGVGLDIKKRLLAQ